jgi:hypothetical protein
MTFRQWLSGLLAGKDEGKSDAMQAPPSGAPEEEEVEGLNFRSAIDAHQKWKSRLQAVIDSTSNETLVASTIARDDQCVLGKWIHGVGTQRFGSHETFQTLRRNHARFHECASEVLVKAQAGSADEALANLKSGEYARMSLAVVMDLGNVYKLAGKK